MDPRSHIWLLLRDGPEMTSSHHTPTAPPWLATCETVCEACHSHLCESDLQAVADIMCFEEHMRVCALPNHKQRLWKWTLISTAGHFKLGRKEEQHMIKWKKNVAIVKIMASCQEAAEVHMLFALCGSSTQLHNQEEFTQVLGALSHKTGHWHLWSFALSSADRTPSFHICMNISFKNKLIWTQQQTVCLSLAAHLRAVDWSKRGHRGRKQKHKHKHVTRGAFFWLNALFLLFCRL